MAYPDIAKTEPFTLDFTPLRKLRRAAELTYAQLGVAAGVSRVTIWRWETNKYPPTIEQVVALARALGAPATDLFRVQENT